LAWAGRDYTLAAVTERAMGHIRDDCYVDRQFPTLLMTSGGVVNHVRSAATQVLRLAVVDAIREEAWTRVGTAAGGREQEPTDSAGTPE